jgi:hypothetical protein
MNQVSSKDAPIGSVGWGYWPIDGNTAVHIAPAIKGSGEMIPPHILSPQCPCGPRQEFTSKGVMMWIHEQVN